MMKCVKSLSVFTIIFIFVISLSPTSYSYSNPTSANINVISENEIYLNSGTKTSIVILCIDGYKYIQTTIYDSKGSAIDVSIVQMLEKSPGGGKPVDCYQGKVTS